MLTIKKLQLSQRDCKHDLLVPWKSLSVSEFNEFEPRLKSAKNRFQLSAGLNLEIINMILSGINNI